MKNDTSGIYLIECLANGKAYVGSSVGIFRRWYEHRRNLKRGDHTCPHLQHVWTCYGEATFRFSILEECDRDKLEEREQHYVDTLQPALNAHLDVKRRYSPDSRAKTAAKNRARGAALTHCPHGHKFTAENSYIDRKGSKICRECNRLRVKGVYAKETTEQREVRRQMVKTHYESNREKYLVQMKGWAALHKDEKREYDKARKARHNELRRQRRQSMTPEDRERVKEQKRQWYAASRERSA